jgi:plasmid stabilization system protein ParE
MGDLSRLYEFLAPVNQKTAAKTVQSLTAALQKIFEQPRIGE